MQRTWQPFVEGCCQNMFPNSGMSVDPGRVWAAWQVAERSLKEVEHVTGQLCTPAVNELRYAGTHFLRAAQEETSPEQQNNKLWKALRHCKRAIYDCYEYGCLHSIEKFDKFKDKWELCLHHFPTVFSNPTYPEVCEEIEKVVRTLTEVDRGENGNRDSYAEEAKCGMQTLRESNEAISKRIPEIAALANKEKKQTRFQILLVVIGILASLLITVISILLTN